MRFGRGKRPKVSGVQGFLVDVGGDLLVDVGGDLLVDVGGDLLVDVGGDLGRQCRRGHLPGTVADLSARKRPHRAASEITVLAATIVNKAPPFRPALSRRSSVRTFVIGRLRPPGAST